jgi:hypothetical protein
VHRRRWLLYYSVAPGTDEEKASTVADAKTLA